MLYAAHASPYESTAPLSVSVHSPGDDTGGGGEGVGAGAPHVNQSDDEAPVLMHVSTGFANGGGEVVPLGTVQSDVPVK